jgi:hypothetical protein
MPDKHPDKQPVRLGAVQETLFITLAARARETQPPRAMRAQLPFGYRYLVPLADPVVGKAMTLTLFRASFPAAGGHAATTPDDGPA